VDRSTPKGPNDRLAYLIPSAPDVKIVPLLSAGERAPNGYRMVGKPDGLGLLNHNDDTFTVLMHHEIGRRSSIERTHGSAGAFISRWIVTKPSHPEGGFKVLSGEDAIKNLFLWDTQKMKYQQEKRSLSRLCSADLARQSAFFFQGAGIESRLFLGGEEVDGYYSKNYGRAFATIVNGSMAGNTYELPKLGNMAFENVVASPYPQLKTIVVALDDSAGQTLDTMGEIYIYIGNKQNTGTPIEKAGLTNGQLYGIAVEDLLIENHKHGFDQNVTKARFKLRNVGDVVMDNGEVLNFNLCVDRLWLHSCVLSRSPCHV